MAFLFAFRRGFLHRSFVGQFFVIGAGIMFVGCGSSSNGRGAVAFDVQERSITELEAALDAGEVTSRELVDGYLARIAAYDQVGPGLNAMVLLLSLIHI